jgi:hypothetical protein
MNFTLSPKCTFLQVEGAAVKIKKPTAILAEKHYRKACCAIESLEKTFQVRQKFINFK